MAWQLCCVCGFGKSLIIGTYLPILFFIIMGTHGVILFYEKCRLCLNKPGTTNIFQEEGLKQDVLDCTGVKVSAKESLPEKICSECLDVVTKAQKLRNLAKRNDSYLKDLFCDDDTLELTQEDAAPTHATKSGKSLEPEITNTKGTDSDKDSEQLKGLQVRKDLFKPASTSTPTPTKNKSTKTFKKEQQSTHKTTKLKIEKEIVGNKCVKCNKTFETSRKLYQHMRQHEKRFHCPLDACEKKFPTRGDLEKHLRTHTGVRPYPCDICDKRFKQMVTLRSHKENVHYCFTHTK